MSSKYQIKIFTFIKPINDIIVTKNSKLERRKLIKLRRDLGIPTLKFN